LVSRKKQRIASLVTTTVFVPAVISFFAYLFATGSPDAVPLLLGVVGSVAGSLAVYLLARCFGSGSSAAGRAARGVTLAVLCLAGLAANAALPFDGAHLEYLLEVLGYGVGLAGFLGLFLLLLPPNDSGWVR
jgi:hypothetical protein